MDTLTRRHLELLLSIYVFLYKNDGHLGVVVNSSGSIGLPGFDYENQEPTMFWLFFEKSANVQDFVVIESFTQIADLLELTTVTGAKYVLQRVVDKL